MPPEGLGAMGPEDIATPAGPLVRTIALGPRPTAPRGTGADGSSGAANTLPAGGFRLGSSPTPGPGAGAGATACTITGGGGAGGGGGPGGAGGAMNVSMTPASADPMADMWGPLVGAWALPSLEREWPECGAMPCALAPLAVRDMGGGSCWLMLLLAVEDPLLSRRKRSDGGSSSPLWLRTMPV